MIFSKSIIHPKSLAIALGKALMNGSVMLTGIGMGLTGGTLLLEIAGELPAGSTIELLRHTGHVWLIATPQTLAIAGFLLKKWGRGELAA